MKNDSWFFPENLPFDSLFDLDGDGELSGLETMIRDDEWLNEFEDEAKPKIPDSLVEEGEQYCIYPENYDSVEAFEADLEEAKYIWHDSDEDDAGVAAPKDNKAVNEYKRPATAASLEEINRQIRESQEKLESLQKQFKMIQEENEQANKKITTRLKAWFGAAIGISFLLAVVYSLTTWGELDFSEITTVGFWLSLSACCFVGLGYGVKQNMEKENRSERLLKVFRNAEDVKKEEQKLSNLISKREQIKHRLANRRNNRE